METKDYNTRPAWTPQQNLRYEGKVVIPQDERQQHPRPQNPGQRAVGQKPRAPEKMPKARALALANMLKKGLAVTSIVGFGTFSGLVALHQVGTTATTTTKTSSGSSQTNSTSSSSSQNSNSFLKQQGGNTSGTSSSSTTSSATTSSASTPVTGTHTS